MRILTASDKNIDGLISIVEAKENAPQNIIFCIPIDEYYLSRLTTIEDFFNLFENGITSKIRIVDEIITIELPISNQKIKATWEEPESFPKFIATIKSFRIEFYLSRVNFRVSNDFEFNINKSYVGDIYNNLNDKKFIVLEPNWKQLDKLFLETGILFIDWQ